MAKLTYFALEGAGSIASVLVERVDAYYAFLRESGLSDLLMKSYALENGLTTNASGATSYALSRGGEQGEMVFSVENHYAGIGNSMVTLTTAQRPAIQCGAANSDYRSLAHTLLANGLVEYWLTERGLEDKLEEACSACVFRLEGFALVEWDVNAGEPYMDRTDEAGAQAVGQDGAPLPPIKTGDIRITALGMLDVIRDPSAPSWDAIEWATTRELVNKHELAARYPEMADRLTSLSPERERARRLYFGRERAIESSELVPLFRFFHKRTAAVPDGRMVIFAGEDIVLYDGPNPYSDFPVKRVTPRTIAGTPFGFTAMVHLMGPQEAVNALDTSIVTNQLGRGIGNIVCDDNADVSVEALSSSMNLIKKRPGSEIGPLEYPSTPAEFFAYKREKISAMEVLSGMNSVVRGNPSENVGQDASGAKLALIQAMAVQSNNGLQKSYVNFLRDICLAIIRRYRDFGGDVPRVARLAGKNKQYLLREFTAADLQDIDRVTVDVGSPLMRTVSGKMTIADKLMELQPAERQLYMSIISAGTYEPLLEGDQSQAMRIRQENERLMDGVQVRALIFDPHWIEVRQHLTVLDNPTLREPGPENEAVASAVLSHIQEHMDLFRTADPAVVLLQGGPDALAMWQQVAAAGMSQTPPPAPGEPSGTAAPESGAEDVSNPEASRPEMPGMPSMPTNPATGEQMQTPGGMA